MGSWFIQVQLLLLFIDITKKSNNPCGAFKMAEKSFTSDVLKKLEEQLTCLVCLDHYNDPKILPCLHSFCHQCLEGLPLDPQEGKLILICPACRATTEIPEPGVAGFPTAFFIKGFSEVYNLLKKVSGQQLVSCDNCNNATGASYCEECIKFFCTGCLYIHNNWTPFANHRLIEVASATFQMSSFKQAAATTCTSHKKPLELYCESCHELICHDCIVRIHKGHDYDLINDTYDMHRQVIESSLEPVREQIALVEEAIKTLTKREKMIMQQREATNEEIDVMFKQILNFFLQSKKKLAEDVDLAARDKLHILAQQKKEVEMALIQLTSCCELVEQGLKIGSLEQVLLAKSQMMNRMKSVVKIVRPELFHPLEQADIEIIKKKIDKNVGEVKYSLFSSSCKVKIVAPPVASMGKESTSTISFEFPDGSPAPIPLSLISCYLTPNNNPPNDNSPTECKVTVSTQSGQYKVDFTPIAYGLHELHVKILDVNIPSSPFSIPVSVSPEMKGTPINIITGLKKPWGVDLTENGQVIVSEHNGDCITVLNKEGEKIISFGTSGTGIGQFKYPSGIAVTVNGTILVADTDNHRIQELSIEGESIRCIGKLGNEALQFRYPKGIAVSKTTGQIFVADEFNHRIQVLNPDFTFCHSFGTEGTKPGRFIQPSDMTIDSEGFVYVADKDNHRIQRFTPEGGFVDMFGTLGTASGQLKHPSGITIDDNDLLYVTEDGNCRLSIFTTNGELIHSFGRKVNKRRQFNQPRELALHRCGYLYICDWWNSRLVVY